MVKSQRLLTIIIVLLFFYSYIYSGIPDISQKVQEEFSILHEYIVVTASKQAQRVSEAPAIVSVVTAETIKKMGAKSLIEVLNTLPGFTMLRYVNAQRLPVVRGIASKDGVLVLFDGITVNDAFEGTFNFYERDLSDVERIEIIRGPGSALYGGYALVSVINIITKKYKEKDSYNINGSYGTFNSRDFALNVEKSFIKELKLTCSLSSSVTDGDDLYIKEDSIGDNYEKYGAVGLYITGGVNPTLTPTSRKEWFNRVNFHTNVDYKNMSIKGLYSRIEVNPIISSRLCVVRPEHLLRQDFLTKVDASYKWKILEE